ALDLLKQLGPATPRGSELLGVLLSVAAGMPDDEALARIESTLATRADAAATACHAVGHAHIDTAWLWPIRETRRKCLRTFTNQLNLMERYPEYVFMCSQAQQYAWIEEEHPAVFEAVKRAVASGAWEPVGGMWVEPDANVPSGESLVRQFVHGTRYWRERFGEKGEQRILYLPDTFGFPAALPQIMLLAGCDTFITNKLWWNGVNEFPHTTFVWRGIDGSEVLAHNTPGRDYNATNTPKELLRGQTSHRTLAPRPRTADGKPASALWLQPFGYGDGGGGATAGMIESAALAQDCGGLPRVRLSGVNEFCDALWAQRETLSASGDDFPAWWGELYLEAHRGTLTTQAWIKAANRRAEDELRFAELLQFAGPNRPTADAGAAAAEKLDRAWKLLLLNQFHDILPGSSIGWVYEDARRDFERITKITDKLIERCTTAWLEGLSTEGVKAPVGVFNPCGAPADAVIELEDGVLVAAKRVPALGVAVVDRAAHHGLVPASVDGLAMSNGVVECELDELGRVVRLARAGDKRGVTRGEGEFAAPMNQLVLYDDRPHMWDAWDIDPGYERSARPVETEPESIEIVREDPLRVAIRVVRALGERSRIEQTYVLDAGSPRVDVHSVVHWHERRTLLRALFPTRILADEATYEIQFGQVKRPTHANTPWDAAKFEACAHRFVDLSMPGVGFALLNDCKYGHSCRDGVVGISLLRSPVHPDPEADQGDHEFCYSMMPHAGDWREAGVDLQAELLNTPPLAYPLIAGETGPLGRAWAPFSLDAFGAAGAMVSAVKRSEDGRGIAVRVYESRGGEGGFAIKWNVPVSEVRPTDLIEREIELDGFSHSGGRTTVMVRPYQIVTIVAKV
ncbi:MAG: alpha-mannosidase, partial [Phycisphaerales bacterium]